MLLENTWLCHLVVMFAAYIVLSCNGMKTFCVCVWPGEPVLQEVQGLVGHL